jgi:pimeloyl-ACP methyl ester carboxylesterase
VTGHLLLVHGANHDGWCWAPVLERLDRAGVRATALDLPLTSFADDTDAVREAVRTVGADPVVLVAHSYGGLPVAAGGHAASRLVFVAARMPAPAESPAALTPRWGHPAFRAAWAVRDDGAVTLTPAAADVLYSGSPRNVAALAAARWRPMWSRVPQEPITDPAWTRLPSTYVVCTGDRTVRVDAQRACAAQADESIELDCDHSPFFSAPDALAEVLAAQATLTAHP